MYDMYDEKHIFTCNIKHHIHFHALSQKAVKAFTTGQESFHDMAGKLSRPFVKTTFTKGLIQV